MSELDFDLELEHPPAQAGQEIPPQLPVLPHLTVIPYYGILNVWQSSPIDTQAFGLTLAASF